MLEKVRRYIKKHHMLLPSDVVVVGVSGGADSVCLLFLLHELQKEMGFRLIVVHVNHGLRLEARRDAEYVADLCQKLELPFFLVEVNVDTLAKEQKISTEEAGRKARYEAFEKVLWQQAPEEAESGKGKIAVAHNSNDRAETMLFHLFRGSGLSGLCSIRPVRGNVIRPLLCLERNEIEAELASRGTSYCNDITNAQDVYTRNKIRHHILPYAEEEINHGTIAHMNQTADILTQAEDFLRQSVEEAYLKYVLEELPDTLSFSVEEVGQCHIFLRQELLRYCLGRMASTQKDISAVHIKEMDTLLTSMDHRSIHLPYGIRARREYGRVLLEKKQEILEKTQEEWLIFPENGYSMEVAGLGVLEFRVMTYENSLNISTNQYTKWFDYDKIEKRLKIRTRRQGDYLTVDTALSRKSVQDYMVNEKIPRGKRDNIWLLADEHHIVWVIGYRISQAYKIDNETKKILQIQIRGGHEL